MSLNRGWRGLGMAVVASSQLALLSCPSVAAELSQSPQSPVAEAFAQGDFRRTLVIAEPLAAKGDPEAEHILGLMYASGWGVKSDPAKAATWYEKAAAQGVIAAQNNLAGMFMQGRGVKQDYAKAAAWYRKAAEKGAAQASYNLGVIYEQGLGVPQDYKEAADWYRKAANVALSSWYQENLPSHTRP